MKKNVVILAMSTLPYAGPKASRFAWQKEDREGTEYYSQLEPISTMIRQREGSLDRVIILATRDSREVKEYTACNLKTSAVDYYLQRMNLDKDAAVIIDVEEDDFIPAISNTVTAIRKYWEENNADVNLWIDTQGSFRNINLVLNAVITLLEQDKIVPRGIYSMNFNFNNKVQRIVDQTETYKIFHFVSGINEFTRSGRAEQLTDYYRQTGKTVPEVIRIMEKIAEAIQMCNMNDFDRYLNELRMFYNRSADQMAGLLGIFREQIENDYGKLLAEQCTGLDVVEWFYKKGFYQQAITYIEAKLPKEWVEKKIISYSFTKEKITEENWKNKKDLNGETSKLVSELKVKLNKTYEEDVNVVIGTMIRDIFWWRGFYIEKKDLPNGYFVDLQRLNTGRDRAYKEADDLNNIDIKIKYQTIGFLHLDICCKEKNSVMDMLLLYKLLKAERNNFNHMSESAVRADRDYLGKAIDTFLKIGKQVYECKNRKIFVNCTNHPSASWPEPQRAAAMEYGSIIDVAFPEVDPELSDDRLEALADETFRRIMECAPAAVMCMGEFVVCYRIIQKLKEREIPVLASCSQRQSVERRQEDGSVHKESVFVFRGFRKY